jgi:hypothetical protein
VAEARDLLAGIYDRFKEGFASKDLTHARAVIATVLTKRVIVIPAQATDHRAACRSSSEGATGSFMSTERDLAIAMIWNACRRVGRPRLPADASTERRNQTLMTTL